MTDDEPFFVTQTFEPEHVATPETARAWIEQQYQQAREEGGRWWRATHNDDMSGILFECWKERPVIEGQPRWKESNDDG